MIVHIRRHLAKRLAFLLSEINCHTGVIIGWHYKCEAYFVKKKLDFLVPLSNECNDVDECIDNDRSFCICRCDKSKIHNTIQFKPHYIILAENNVLCYLPQGTKILVLVLNYISSMSFHPRNKIYLFFLFQILYQYVHLNVSIMLT